MTFPFRDFNSPLFDKVVSLILPLHEESMYRYSENAEFLFWHGFMKCRTNWLCYPDESESEQMISKAYEMAPENKLYAWAVSEGNERYKYTMEIVNDNVLMESIVAKGPVGIYLSGLLRYSVEHAKMNASE